MNSCHRISIRGAISIFMLMIAIICSAQSNGDKLFMEGQALQRKQTISAQVQAIRKFEAAKVVYTAAAKKKMCDNQIIICNNNIAYLRKRPQPDKSKLHQKDVSRLSLSQDSVNFDGDKMGQVSVAVTAPTMEWHFRISEGIEGEEEFITANRSSDSKSIDINVAPNPRTIERRQTMKVIYGNTIETLYVFQSGKEVSLSTNNNLVEFKLKGGSKNIELYTNSDSIVNSNNGLTWYIESKPEWVETSVEVQKKKSALSKGLKAIKGLVGGSDSAVTTSDSKVYNIKIIARPLPKNSSEYNTGRKGEIVFVSQNKKHSVTIIQQ